MKIVVLAGGLSPERAVSLVTGGGVCRALRENGHRAVLVDSFLGLADAPEDLNGLFDAPDGLCRQAEVSREAPDLEAVRRSRGDRSPSRLGPRVLEICALADAVFLGLHGCDGEDGRIQAALDLLGVPYTGSGHLASGIAMDKAVSKRMMESAGIRTPRWRLLDCETMDAETLAAEHPFPTPAEFRQAVEREPANSHRTLNIILCLLYEREYVQAMEEIGVALAQREDGGFLRMNGKRGILEDAREWCASRLGSGKEEGR